MNRAFSTTKEVKEFSKNYENGDIETEVISNILQPYYIDKYPSIKTYCDFWFPEDKIKYGLTSVLKLILGRFAKNALEEKYGKHDFSFEGNRTYQNYVLEFEGLKFITPAKTEVVLTERLNLETVKKIISFDNYFNQFVMDYVMKNFHNLKDFQQNHIQQMKNENIIDQDGKINFHLIKAVPKLK